jgi:hypothetical protein
LPSLDRACLQRDLLGLVADALEVVVHVDRGEDLAQVDRDRLQPCDHLVAHQIGLHMHPVDLGFVDEHLGDQAQILGKHRIDRAVELPLDQPGHGGGCAAQPVEVGVELTVGVLHL